MKKIQIEKIKKKKKRKTAKKWTKEEDQKLKHLIKIEKITKWSKISKYFQNRKGKQIRERWRNHLDPRLIKTKWILEEEWILFLYQKLLGNKWSEISELFKNRSENDCKNHYHVIKNKNYGFLRKFEEKLGFYLSGNFFDLDLKEKKIFDMFFKYPEIEKRKYLKFLNPIFESKKSFNVKKKFDNLEKKKFFITPDKKENDKNFINMINRKNKNFVNSTPKSKITFSDIIISPENFLKKNNSSTKKKNIFKENNIYEFKIVYSPENYQEISKKKKIFNQNSDFEISLENFQKKNNSKKFSDQNNLEFDLNPKKDIKNLKTTIKLKKENKRILKNNLTKFNSNVYIKNLNFENSSQNSNNDFDNSFNSRDFGIMNKKFSNYDEDIINHNRIFGLLSFDDSKESDDFFKTK